MRVPKINGIEQKITRKASKKERKSRSYRKRIFFKVIDKKKMKKSKGEILKAISHR